MDHRPEELREEIAGTRDRIPDTIDALDERRSTRARAKPAPIVAAMPLLPLWLASPS